MFSKAISPPGEFGKEKFPTYADDLALIRLKILERQERYQEYLYLAASRRATSAISDNVGGLGRVEEAMSAAKTEMNSMEEAFAFAKTLAEQGSLTASIRILPKLASIYQEILSMNWEFGQVI